MMLGLGQHGTANSGLPLCGDLPDQASQYAYFSVTQNCNVGGMTEQVACENANAINLRQLNDWLANCNYAPAVPTSTPPPPTTVSAIVPPSSYPIVVGNNSAPVATPIAIIAPVTTPQSSPQTAPATSSSSSTSISSSSITSGLGLPATIFGIDSTYVLIGGAALLFFMMSGGKK